MAASDLSSIGQSVRRKEDYRFLTGAGRFTDDVSEHASDMARISCARRTRTPGSAASTAARPSPRQAWSPIFTGDDLTGVNGLPCGWLITGTDGKPMNEPPHPVLAQGKVRYVGARTRRRCASRRSPPAIWILRHGTLSSNVATLTPAGRAQVPGRRT